MVDGAPIPVQREVIPNPLPYIIVFAFLFVIGLIALTWTLDVWYKANQCVTFPNVWCSDTWVCNNSCPTGEFNACFASTGTTGLASCLFGPNSAVANVCFNIPSGDTGLSCTCSTGMAATNNCFSGCAQNFDSITGNPICCCKEGPNCTPNAAECQSQNG